MADNDSLKGPARQKWRIRFGLIESFILIFILFAGFEFFVDYNESISASREQTVRLFVQTSKNVQIELGNIHDAVNLLLNSARANREAVMFDPAKARPANALFIPYLRQYPFITSINFGDATGNGYLLLRTGKQLQNRIKNAVEKERVTWFTLGEKGEIISTENRRDDYDPRETPWYLNSLTREGIVWSTPYSFRTTREMGITASLRLVNITGRSEVVGVDITLNEISHLLATFTAEIKGLKAHLLTRDGTVIATSEVEQFRSLLQQDDSPLAKIGNSRYPILEKALQSQTGDKASSFKFGNKRFLAIMQQVSFSPNGKFNLVLTVPEDALGDNFAREALWRLAIVLLLLILATAWYFVRYLIPLRRIAVSIKEFGSGKLPMLSADAARKDEIGDLASEFILMTDALAKGKEFPEKLIENSAAATFVLDPQHKVVLWNKACEELTGIVAADIVGTGNHWSAFYAHERPCLADIVLDAAFDELSGLYSLYEKSTLVPDGLHAEGWYHNLNGRDRYILFDAAPVFDNSGNLLAAIETLQDISAQKRADELLHARESQQKALLNNIPDIAWVKDIESRFLAVNEPFARACGRTADELAGLTDLDIWPDDLALGYMADDWEVMTSHLSKRAEESLVDAQGRKLWIETIKSPMFDEEGRLTGTVGIARDITERKQAEKDLLLQSAALQAAANAIVITDKNGSIEWVNPAFTTLTGYSADEAIGRNPRELVKSGVHDHAFFKQMWDTLLAGDVWHGQITNRHKNGALYPEGQTITPVKDARGEITHFIAIKRDLSEHRKLEEQLRQSQKMESVGTLAGGIAHDFNNILTAIIGYGQITRMKMSADDPLQYNIKSMLEAADRAASLTQELLLFSRKKPSDKKQVDLNEVVAMVEKFLKKVISEDIVYKTDLLEAPLPVLADEHQLEQVLMNLATNAGHAMPKGGTLTVTTAKVVLDDEFVAAHGYGKPGPYALITFSDSGSGMDKETRRRIFEPFFTTKGVGKGTGLGLAVSYGIIKQHDGYIKVYSEPGLGTTFRIYLPVIAAPREEATREEQEEAVVRGTETILLAEDDKQVRILSASILENAGYTVIAAVDGADAVSKFIECGEHIDLLLFDLIMPNMNGKEALDEIRKARPGIRAIFASGYAPDTIRQKVSLTEGIHLIAKPISPAELLRKVRSLLDEVQ